MKKRRAFFSFELFIKSITRKLNINSKKKKDDTQTTT